MRGNIHYYRKKVTNKKKLKISCTFLFKAKSHDEIFILILVSKILHWIHLSCVPGLLQLDDLKEGG